MPVLVPASNSPVAGRGARAQTWLPLYMPWPVPMRISVSPRSVLLQTDRPLVATYSRGIAVPFIGDDVAHLHHRLSTLLKLDAGDLDDLRPFGEVAPDDRGHLRGRGRGGIDSGLSETLAKVGIV